MATIRDTVKLYIYRDPHDGRVQYYTVLLEYCDWLVLVGETEVSVEYNDSDLIDPRTAQLAAAEQALERHRADAQVKEQLLIDRVQSLKALTHDGGRGDE